MGPAVRRTGRRVLRTKSRVLSNSSLSDIFSHAHASYLVATSFNYWTSRSIKVMAPPRDPPATKKNYLATRFNECAPPCTRCSSSEGRLQNPHSTRVQHPSSKYAWHAAVSRPRHSGNRSSLRQRAVLKKIRGREALPAFWEQCSPSCAHAKPRSRRR